MAGLRSRIASALAGRWLALVLTCLAPAFVAVLAPTAADAQAFTSSVSGVVGAPMNVTPTYGVGGGFPQAPFAFCVMQPGPAMPAGLTLNADCSMTGTPTTAGVTTVLIEGLGTPAFAFGASVTITIAPFSAAPATAASAAVTTPFQTAINIAAPVSGATSVGVASNPSRGTVSVNGLGFTYTPNAGFIGTDSFTYAAAGPGGVSAAATITVTVLPGPPGAAARTVSVPFNSPGFVIDMTSSLTGVAVSVQSVTAPAHGAVSASGLSFTYVPARGFAGADSFTYRAVGPGGLSSIVTLNIVVQGLPDPTLDPDTVSIIGAEGDQVVGFADLQVDNVNGHLEGTHGGASGGSNLSFAAGGGFSSDVPGLTFGRGGDWQGITPVTPAVANLNVAPGLNRPVAVWTAGGVDFSRRSASRTRAETKSVTIGVTAGVDFRLSPDLLVGVAGGYNRDKARVGSFGSQSEASGYFGLVYASYKAAPDVYIDGFGGYGAMDFDSQRYVGALGTYARGSRSGDAWLGSLTIGLDRVSGGVDWTPYGRISAVSGSIDGFTETGGGDYNLAYGRQKVESVVLAAGVKASKAFKVEGGVLRPRLRLEYLGAARSSDRVSMRYPAWTNSPLFGLSERTTDRNQLVGAVGGQMTANNGMILDAEVSSTVLYDDHQSQQITVSLRWPF